MTRALRQQSTVCPALPKGFEGREPLYGVEKIGSQSAIGVAAFQAAGRCPFGEAKWYDERKQCKTDKYQCGEQVKPAHAEKNQQRRQRCHGDLRKKLSEASFK